MKLRKWGGTALFLLALSFTPLARAEETAEEGTLNWVHLEPYRPIYFIMGHPYTKIDFSFKTKIVERTPLYFGYTQLMMWDLFIDHPYFEDLNYNPQLFYRFSLGHPTTWLDAGLDHESNGKGGTLERSWYRVYSGYHLEQRIGDDSKLSESLKAWVPFWYQRNPDILKYRGLWELEITLSKFLDPSLDTADVTLRIYPGGEFYTNPALGGQELTFRAKALALHLFPLLVVQIFHGFAENLSDYDFSRFGLRAGVGF